MKLELIKNTIFPTFSLNCLLCICTGSLCIHLLMVSTYPFTTLSRPHTGSYYLRSCTYMHYKFETSDMQHLFSLMQRLFSIFEVLIKNSFCSRDHGLLHTLDKNSHPAHVEPCDWVVLIHTLPSLLSTLWNRPHHETTRTNMVQHCHISSPPQIL